jgi:TonB family protein
MNRRWGVALAGAIQLTAPTWGQIDAGGAYHALALRHAGDVTYPMNSSTTGIVTLDIRVDATGTVQNVGVVWDVPPLTGAAQSAVRSWQFTPAMVNGLATAGTVRVHVVFNPFNPSGVGLPSPHCNPRTATKPPTEATSSPHR